MNELLGVLGAVVLVLVSLALLLSLTTLVLLFVREIGSTKALREFFQSLFSK
jgi:hypothetical protein